jgi:ABC-2 type transport system ATP-binding protein
VILSTHIVDDVRELCPRMAIIANGELLLEGAPDEALWPRSRKDLVEGGATDDELRARNSAARDFHASGRRAARGPRLRGSLRATVPAVDSDLEDVYFLNLSQQPAQTN